MDDRDTRASLVTSNFSSNLIIRITFGPLSGVRTDEISQGFWATQIRPPKKDADPGSVDPAQEISTFPI